MLMAYRVNERALEFNEYFLCEMLGSSSDNRMHLELARSALRDILRTELTERQRELLILYYYEGLRETEIALVLHLHKSTVSRTLNRARSRVRKHLRFYFDYMGVRLGR